MGAYSIYLFHLPLGDFVGRQVIKIIPNYPIMFVAPWAALVVLAIVTWFAIESPIISAARCRWKYEYASDNAAANGDFRSPSGDRPAI